MECELNAKSTFAWALLTEIHTLNLEWKSAYYARVDTALWKRSCVADLRVGAELAVYLRLPVVSANVLPTKDLSAVAEQPVHHRQNRESFLVLNIPIVSPDLLPRSVTTTGKCRTQHVC